MSRQSARTAVTNWFAPPNVANLTKVYPAIPKHGILGTDFVGPTSAVGVVHIADSKETRLAPPWGQGRKLILYVFWLILDCRTALTAAGDTGAAFDTLLDATVARLRADPTFAGAFTQVGEQAGSDITVVSDVPVENGRVYQQLAHIEFTATEVIQG